MKNNYFILNFGRHSDLLNIAIEIKTSLAKEGRVAEIFCNSKIIDGEDITKSGFNFIKLNQYFSTLIKLDKSSVVHSVSPSMGSLLFCLLSKFFGASVFYNIHRFDFSSYKLIKGVGVFVYTFFVFLISNIVYVHVQNRKSFLFWSKKIIYAELPEFGNLIGKVDPNVKGKEVLFFGRIDTNKGLDLLYKIILSLPKTKFTIAGELVDKSLMPVLDKISNCHNATLKIGRVNSEHLPELFQNTLLVIMPYTGATQSGIPYLARSLITPVLVSNVGEMHLTVQDNAYGELATSRNPTDWIQLIENIDWGKKRDLIANKIKTESKDNIYCATLRDYEKY